VFKNVLVLFFIITSLTTFGQPVISGYVKDANSDEALQFCNVQEAGTTNGTTTNESGNFKLQITGTNNSLVISYMGYKTDTLTLTGKTFYNIALRPLDNSLQEVVISGTMQEVSKTESPIPVEVYTPKLFQKNPSPNIFESLGMINGIQPQLNCNVCNTGDIHINGMEGPYTMILIDGMPIVSSLATVYGLMGIPQSMVRRIEIVKGPASTLYGSEAVAGLVNIITTAPESAPPFKVEVSGTTRGEFNTDVAARLKLKKASSLLGVNYFNYLIPSDINKDNFTDVTLQNRISIFNKWNFTRIESRVFSIAARYVYENRYGGELQWKDKYHRGSDSIYGESIYTHRAELIGTYQLPIPKQALMFDYSYNYHFQDSYYGTVKYLASQHVMFAQLRWSKNWKKINLLTGIPFRFIYYDDNTPATSNLQLTKNKPAYTYLPGVFVQTEYTPHEVISILAGMRYEYHNEHGSIFSPRLAFKIVPVKNHTIRLSGGNGFRVVNLFTEDHAALTGARQVVIANKLKPEQSWNGNINYTAFINHKHGFVNADISGFYTYFTNKIVADFFTDPTKIIYDNLDGHAVSAGVSTNLDFNFTNGFKMLIGATYMQVYIVEKDSFGDMKRRPQIHAPNFTANYALSYTFNKLGLTIDYTGKLTGPMYLPVVPNDYRPAQSPWFCIMNVQLTQRFKHGIEVFAGVKNMLNFIPKDPILRPFDPFDKTVTENNPNGYTFDPSYNYAPVQGVKGFLGIRYTLQN
jgi:outer membrane receptor for ferrienterochelin and colicins